MTEVMIVDDESIERAYLTQIFKSHQREFFVIGEACNGNEAVEVFRKMRPQVVVMDIEMPGLNGIDAAILIKEIEPKTIIILNTAYAEFEFARRAVENHLDAYILKPSSDDLILSTIRKCIRSDEAVSSNPPKTTDEIKHYLKVHYNEKITLDKLAKIAHFSPAYLSHVFHQEQGITIRAYLNEVRMECAKNLLKNTTWNINEIAQRSGFGNTTHFNRLFKKVEGVSPQDYRRGGTEDANTEIK